MPTKNRMTKTMKTYDLEFMSPHFFDFNKSTSSPAQARMSTIETIDSGCPNTAFNDPSLSSSQYQSKLSARSKDDNPKASYYQERICENPASFKYFQLAHQNECAE